jgi:hypothetical protein
MEGRLILWVVILSVIVRTEILYEQECNCTAGFWREG